MKKSILLLFAAAVAFVSCKKSKYPGYELSETGLYYKYYTHDEEAKAPSIGDIITMAIVLKNSTTDSVIFDSKKLPNEQQGPLQESRYKGSIEEGFAMLNEGDSASFIVNADSLYAFSKVPKPKFLKEGDALKFEVKMIKVQSQEDFQKEMEKKMAAMAGMEDSKLKSYLASKGIKQTPDSSGLYIMVKQEGKGPVAQKGDSVSVHYEGTFLDGTIFDSSLKRKKPIGFRVGVGAVIPGWDIAFSKLKKGTKATLIIPSKLAYGNGGGQLPPYATLVFDVELLEVLKK